LITQFEITASPVLSATRQVLDLAEAELDIGQPGPGGIVARLFQHLMGHVDPDHPSIGADLPGREKAIEPRAAAEVDDDLAGPQRCDRLRVAATEARLAPSGTPASSTSE
jgi:hypothetical protein